MVIAPLWLNLLPVIALCPIFLALSLLVFYLPGYFILNKSRVRLRNDEIIVLGFSIGIIAFLVQGIVFTLIHTPFLSFLSYLAITIYCLKKFGLTMFLPLAQLLKEKFLTLILLLGTLVEGFINFPSGFTYGFGDLYWSAHGHDGLWHIAVIQALKQGFPPENLLYAGEKIFNYHYFLDIIIVSFNNLFPFFSSFDLYFRYFTFLIAILMGLSSYSFLATWQKNKTIGLLGIFFTYFVGSFGYIVLAIQGRGFFGGETIFWVSQGNTMIGNPPQAICFVFIPAFFLALHHYLQKNERLFFLIIFLLGGFLIGFKVYAAILVIAGLSVASFTRLVFSKKKDILLLTISIGLSNFIILKAISKDVGNFLIFEPWWFIRTMVVTKLDLIDLELRRQFYLARGGWKSFLRIVEYETIAFLIFLLGNLGTRIIGFWEIFKSFKKGTTGHNPFEIALLGTMVTGFIIPLFFLQKGVAYNSIQFMQYFLLIFGFFAAISLYNFLTIFKKRVVKIFVLSLFIALSIPTVIGNLVEFYGKNPLAIVTNQEIEALDSLKKMTTDQDIVLTKPFNPYSRRLYKHQPWPIYAWDSTGYVSAYTGRQTYYTDEGQMRILGMETEERLNSMKQFFEEKTTFEQKKEFLENEKISFLYLRIEELNPEQVKDYPLLGFREVFRNDEVVIFHLGEQKS